MWEEFRSWRFCCFQGLAFSLLFFLALGNSLFAVVTFFGENLVVRRLAVCETSSSRQCSDVAERVVDRACDTPVAEEAFADVFVHLTIVHSASRVTTSLGTSLATYIPATTSESDLERLPCGA